MRRILQSIWFIQLAGTSLFSQQLTDSAADAFIQKFIHSSPEIQQWIEPTELAFAERLGIHYENVAHKFFIGNDFPDSIKSLLQLGKLRYSSSIEKLTGQYSMLTVSLSQISARQKFYFKNRLCISSISYFTRGWKKYDGTYLSFRVSDTSQFNSYSMIRLNNFVEKVMDILKFTKEERNLLQRKKILYIRCKNEDEVEQITGFKTLGMAMLSHDAVVTQFNCHYHELVHILINYKLKNLPLYTHPFFQEGIAVALGGRGGKEVDVILELGHFIAISGFETYTTLLHRNNFFKVDPSISYALSGLYNSFLLSSIGDERYKNLYLKFSNSNPGSIQSIPEELLLSHALWDTFLTSYAKQKLITLTNAVKGKKVIWNRNVESISENESSYFFAVQDTLTILSKDHQVKYIISVTPEEIRIFNAASGNTIANFAVAFSSPPETIPYDGHTYKFSVRKKVFDETLSKNHSFIVD